MSNLFNPIRTVPLLGMCVALGALLSACGTRHVSHDVSPEGKAGQLVFPDPATVLLDAGTFPNRDDLRAVGAGVTKDQLYALLGRPHFREGIRAREWDYLFHFRTAEGIVTCQYKVIFDEAYHGRSFHWAPASCGDLLADKAIAPAATPIATATKRFELSGDALFRFNGRTVADILPGGREQVAEIAAELRQADLTSVQVIGHTDRLGSDAYNQALSQQRALAVRSLLIDHGVPPTMISAIGAGESQPVQQCAADTPHATQIACLQPNRRVEIVAHGAH